MHLGRLDAARGFSRLVAIKQLHPWLAENPAHVKQLAREARLTARIAHPNVVQTLDVVEEENGISIVMEFVRGVSLSRLLAAARERGERLPTKVVVAVILDVLRGLHAAHEARDESGRPLAIVHRDVSPQNVLVDKEGTARVLDFGIAKALGFEDRTRTGELKGKLAYMAPEQLLGEPVTRQTDLYAVGVLLWESLTGQSLFGGSSQEPVVLTARMVAELPPSPRLLAPEMSAELEQVVLQALAPAARDRFANAEEMSIALGTTTERVTPEYLAEHVSGLVADELELQNERIRAVESFVPENAPTALVPSDLPPAASSRRWAFVAAPLVVVAALGMAAFAALRWSAKENATAALAPPIVAPILQAELAPAGSHAMTEAPPADLPPAARPSAEAQRQAPPTRPTHPRSRSAPSAKTSPASPDCTLPYVIDANGQKRYKANCL